MLQNCGDSNNPDLWYGVLRGLLTLSTLSGHERLSNVPCAQRINTLQAPRHQGINFHAGRTEPMTRLGVYYCYMVSPNLSIV